MLNGFHRLVRKERPECSIIRVHRTDSVAMWEEARGWVIARGTMGILFMPEQ